MTLKRWLIGKVPDRYQVPLRYWYRVFGGRVDKERAAEKRLVEPGHVAIDIGANMGLYTYMLAGFCDRVEAFEPLPECARILRAFPAKNVRVHQVALSSQNGTRELYTPLNETEPNMPSSTLTALHGPRGVHKVQVQRLDDYAFQDVSFVKIDVEGHECDVLKGGFQTIRGNRPILLVEIEERHIAGPVEEVFRQITEMGYQGAFVSEGQLQPLESFSIEKHQRQYLSDVQNPAYINNFLFVPDAQDRTRHDRPA